MVWRMMQVADDDRVTCLTCRHYRAGWCHDAKRAGLSVRDRLELARELAELLQRCPAHLAKP